MSRPATESKYKRVGQNLYRYNEVGYYALFKLNGKQIRRSLETSDLALAKRRLRRLRDDLDQINPSLSQRTMEQHRVIFESLLSGAASTLANKRRNIAKLVDTWPRSNPSQIGKITQTQVLLWLKPHREKLSPASLNSLITDIRAFFAQAVADKVIVNSPAAGLVYSKRRDIISKTPSWTEFLAIVADIRCQASNGHGAGESADAVELAGTLGLGQAELSRICRRDIDLERGTIRLVRVKSGVGFTIPIFPAALPIIERRLAALPRAAGTRLVGQRDFKRAMEGACRRLGFDHFSPRSLRRMHITAALRRGIDAPTIAKWQGHQDGGKLVLKTYQAELSEEHSQLMAEKMRPAASPTSEKIVQFKKASP